MPDNQILQVMQRDFPEDFRDALHGNLAGAYDRSFEDIARPPGAFIPTPTPEINEMNYLAARKARRAIGMTALMQTAQQCGIPFQIKRLACNGQRIVVAQLGQILLVAEPVDHLAERPNHADYKAELAASHFAIRQLEMDFGPHPEEARYRQRIDARNTMLVVVQHGMRGGDFNRRDTAFSMFNVAVPDATLGSWLWKANAMNGELDASLDWTSPIGKSAVVQEDRVTISVKAGYIQKSR